MKVILLRFGEMFLKGENKKYFEKALEKDIEKKLKEIPHVLKKTQGRYIISNIAEEDIVRAKRQLSYVFGLASYSEAEEVESTQQQIEAFIKHIKIGNKTFKVELKRADKSFPILSMEYVKTLGEIVLNANKDASVDLYEPEIKINVDIRQNGKTYISSDVVQGQGGLPNGTGGKALLLLSGGIDSPVAGYMMAKRGLSLEALHFYSYPYTSEKAKEKVMALARKLSNYVDEIRVHAISFTKVQEAIHMNCDAEYMITIMRRIMMRIAERICKRDGLGAIITGESLGQVASQTMQSMTVTNEVIENTPVFRPCVGMDKEDIVKIAKAIDTFETSIQPYEDCCTVFLPKNPVIRPTIKRASREEEFLNIENLIEDCLNGEELINITQKCIKPNNYKS